jgi:hypothetical protein
MFWRNGSSCDQLEEWREMVYMADRGCFVKESIYISWLMKLGLYWDVVKRFKELTSSI